jgi:hypothetical protein
VVAMSDEASMEKKTGSPSKRSRPSMEGPDGLSAAMGKMSLGGRSNESLVCSECSKNRDAASARS